MNRRTGTGKCVAGDYGDRIDMNYLKEIARKTKWMISLPRLDHKDVSGISLAIFVLLGLGSIIL